MGKSICNAVAEQEISGEWSEEEAADDKDRHPSLIRAIDRIQDYYSLCAYLSSPVKRSREMLTDLHDSRGVFDELILFHIFEDFAPLVYWFTV